MSDLVTTFEARLESEQNRQMISNVELIVDAHKDRPLGYEENYMYKTERNLVTSAQPTDSGIFVNRPFKTIVGAHGLDQDQLVNFAAGGRVADVGCGRSGFLDAFVPVAERLAVDSWPNHVEFQRQAGHKALLAFGYDMHEVETNSVRLLNASWSLPFWSVNTAEARTALREYARVLEPGGLALIGGIMNHELREEWEQALDQRRNGNSTAGPWFDGYHAYDSHILAAFLEELIYARTQGTLGHGYLDTVGTRVFVGRGHDYRADCTESHVPSHIMMRKVV